MAKETITGYISNYIYTSNDSLYKVCKLVTEDNDEVIIVGNFPRLEDGLNYEFVGEFKTHPKYGFQFVVNSYAKSKNFTKEGLIHYLSSEKFYGIGPKLASNIVEELGNDCIDIILKDKDSLDKVYGITKAKKEIVYNTLKENYKTEQVFIRLYGIGLSSKMVYRLHEKYEDRAYNVIEENPYCLIDDIDGFGFKKTDSLALSMGVKPNDIRRIMAAITYTLNYVCYQQGFTFLTKTQLFNSVMNLLQEASILDNDLNKALAELIKENKLIIEQERIFPKALYQAEVKCANKIDMLYKGTAKLFKEDSIKKIIEEIETNLNIRYTDLQRDAIIKALSNKLSIITGGPGTGKSTILNGILYAYAKLNDKSITDDDIRQKVLLVAPTGRAAKRMTETTNFKASTIHKALGYNYDGGFNYNENCLLNCSLAIVDEASMLDIELASSFFKALPNSCCVILVGDSNQLPSVGPGNVLHDLMQSDVFKITKLTQIMRQANDSDIIKLSHMVLNEKIAYNIFSNRKEVFFYNYDTKDALDGIHKILDNFISSGGDLIYDIQILIPMYAGVAGIDAVNESIQARYNKNDKFIKRDNLLFKVGDKVLQLKNDQELDIMNGDIGKILDITKIDNKDALLIDFDGRVVTYYTNNLDNLKLAYAISIHKSQGSEFNNVIMPILPSYQIMLKKKIIYTGITRAKKKLILLGKIESLNQAITQLDYERQTTLFQKISNFSNQNNKIYDPNIPFEYLGEYDMDGITPYTFMK